VRFQRDHPTVTYLGDGLWLFTEDERLDPACHWDFQESAARRSDAWDSSNNSSFPPNAAALVTAVRRTELRRLFPFTAHEYLCFRDGVDWHSGADQIAPACVSQDPEHGYVVWDGGPYGKRRPALTTQDPGEAAAKAEGLLAGWSSPAGGSTDA
jgi:hypothetical protein